MFDPPVEISYKTTVELPRQGPVGRLLAWVGRHPVLGGLLSGVAVVLFAAFRASEGVRTEPLLAAALSLVVIGTWMFFFFLMRRFFQAQSHFTQPVLRKISIGSDQAIWLQNGEPQRIIDAPRVRILTEKVPESVATRPSSARETAWPVWIVIDSSGAASTSLIFETRDSTRNAMAFEETSPDLIAATDERLPRAILLPLLQRLTQPSEAESPALEE